MGDHNPGRGFLRGKYLILTLFIAVAGFLPLFLLRETRNPELTVITVPVSDLPAPFEEFTILHLSDLHGARFGPGQGDLGKLLRGQKIDLAVFTGDLVSKGKPAEVAAAGELLAEMTRWAPTYLISGNWDRLHFADVNEIVRGSGAVLLANQAIRIEKDNAGLWLVGIDIPFREEVDLETVLAQVKSPGEPLLLLVHSPDIPLVNRAAEKGVAVILAGHTHGGQIRLPGIGALLVPGQPFPPRYVAGLYTVGKAKLYVNRGLGTSVIPVRLLVRPEVALIRLVRGV